MLTMFCFVSLVFSFFFFVLIRCRFDKCTSDKKIKIIYFSKIKTILENPDHKVSKNEIEKLSEEVRNDK